MALSKRKGTTAMTKQYQRIKAKVKPDYLEKDSAFRDCTADKVYTGAVLLNDELEVDILGKEATIKDDQGDYVCCTTRTVQVGNGVYMIIAVCPKFSNVNKDDADAVNDVVVLFVGDAMADLMNAGEAANED